jgi:hypothetical protein
MIFDGFIGGSYESVAVAWDAQRCMNLYPESDQSGKGKSNLALIGTPGLALFDTLPTSPVRGMWTGLADNLPGSTAVDLMYVVAGSKLYQVLSGGTHTQIGDVGTDAGNTPVTMQVNGGQIFITSAGLGWIYNGSTLVRAYMNNGLGTVNTSGTAVTWVSGDPFNVTQVGSGIVIGGSAYMIAAWTDAAHITLASSAGTLTGAVYRVMAAAGTVNTSATNVAWTSGDTFFGLQAGDPIVIGTTLTTVSVVISPVALIAGAAFPLTFGVGYNANKSVQAATSAFLDTYFVALAPDSKTVNISAPNDGTAWNPLDFAAKEGFPDNVSSIFADHEELWVFGSETTEVWQDTGAATFPLQRIGGGFIRAGIRAPFSPVSVAQGVAWIGGDERGNPIAVFATGFQPQRISTHAVETQWASYATVTDATAFVHILRGHQFWVINFPTGNATWVWDATSGLWHERGWWNGATLDRHRGGTHGYAWGRHYVGDWSTGALYWLDESLFTDAGTQITRIRTAPHFSNEELFTFYHRLRVAMLAGPNPTLTWSDDSGQTYRTPVAASGRYIGTALQESAWRRLGKGRDRVFSMTITDALEVVIVAAYLDVEAGSA